MENTHGTRNYTMDELIYEGYNIVVDTEGRRRYLYEYILEDQVKGSDIPVRINDDHLIIDNSAAYTTLPGHLPVRKLKMKILMMIEQNIRNK